MKLLYYNYSMIYFIVSLSTILHNQHLWLHKAIRALKYNKGWNIHVDYCVVYFSLEKQTHSWLLWRLGLDYSQMQ
jgi:hypothetical protein